MPPGLTERYKTMTIEQTDLGKSLAAREDEGPDQFGNDAAPALSRKAADKKARLLDEHTSVLSAEDREALGDELREVRREAVLDPTPSAYAHALRAAALLPQSTLRQIIDLRFGNDCDLGIVLIRNTPVDPEIPNQPKPTRLWHEKPTSVSEAMHLVVHAAIGSAPISYEVENGGDTIATLAPKPGDEVKQESTSSETLLELHGENQAHAFPPDVLVLSNLQEDGRTQVGTIIASNRLAIQRLSAKEIEIGRRPIFVIDPPLSFKGVGPQADQPRLIPMFYGCRDDLMLNFDAHAMRSIEPEGEQLIETMKRVLRKVAVTVYLRRGDLLLIDNRVVAHGRFAFKADYGHPRINQRSFGQFDLAATRVLRRRGSTILRWTN